HVHRERAELVGHCHARRQRDRRRRGAREVAGLVVRVRRCGWILAVLVCRRADSFHADQLRLVRSVAVDDCDRGRRLHAAARHLEAVEVRQGRRDCRRGDGGGGGARGRGARGRAGRGRRGGGGGRRGGAGRGRRGGGGGRRGGAGGGRRGGGGG